MEEDRLEHTWRGVLDLRDHSMVREFIPHVFHVEERGMDEDEDWGMGDLCMEAGGRGVDG